MADGYYFDDDHDLPPPEEEPTDLRPEVRLEPQKPHQVVDELASYLHLDQTLYVRGKQLVTVVGALPPNEDEPAPIAENTPVIVPVTPPTLTERITRHIRIVRRKPLTKQQAMLVAMGGKAPPTEWVPALPPALVVQALLARGQWPLRHLTAVSETPILRPDGSIMQTPGYDPVTGYVYRPTTPFPEVPENPTRHDAELALEQLAEVFCDFPYVDKAASMVPIAAILTVIARSAINGACPAFILDATTRGSGKTLQADAISAVTLGRSAARKSYPNEDEEIGKVLAAYALAGARLILFDNIPTTREFGGGELDQAITARDSVEIRVLGRSEVRRLPWNAVIMASGNNIALSEDTVRRVLIARLETQEENPEDRTNFRHPMLFEWILANRPRLVVAALTILRAFTRLGFHRDEEVKTWGSFESWSRLVPRAIVFAGGADPMLARPNLQTHASDATRALATVLEMLPRLDPQGVGISTRDLVQRLYPSRISPEERSTDGFDSLRDALEAWAPPKAGQPPSIQLLGKRLRANVGRVLNGKRLVRLPEEGRTPVRWVVQ